MVSLRTASSASQSLMVTGTPPAILWGSASLGVRRNDQPRTGIARATQSAETSTTRPCRSPPLTRGRWRGWMDVAPAPATPHRVELHLEAARPLDIERQAEGRLGPVRTWADGPLDRSVAADDGDAEADGAGLAAQ